MHPLVPADAAAVIAVICFILGVLCGWGVDVSGVVECFPDDDE